MEWVPRSGHRRAQLFILFVQGFSFVAVLMSVPSPTFASDAGLEGMLFARMATDARGAALGAAGMGVSEGVSALYANPAGSALQKNLAFGTTYQSRPGGFQGGSLFGLYPVGDESCVAASLSLLTHGDLRVTTDAIPDGTGELAGFLGVEGEVLGTQWINGDTAAGVGLRFLHEDLAGATAEGFAVDTGLAFAINPALTAGVAIRGLGQEVKSKDVRDPFPLSVLLGGRFSLDPSPVRIYAGGNWAPNSVSSAGAGLEVGDFSGISLRGSGEWRETGTAGFAFGIGGRSEMWNVDYTWSSAGSLGGVHRVTLLLRFARPDKRPQ